ncbi:MAG TPA: zf-HC2 domain-containing protein [Candidatus Limnocylindrales bacterium]|nr:zf-HC2 domain-containing protein [Candidatus Limnocylindrales bacterium]
MKGRQNAHARFRELIAARLDGPLTRPELRSLSAHLKTCPQCRQVDREYREQRERLHTLPSPIPPRDLWARTSSALDREVARGSYRRPGYRRVFGRRRSATPAAALVTSVAAVALAGVLVALQFGPSLQRAPTNPGAMPTPFAVSPQSLAFVGSGPQDISVYRARVSQVCPTTAPDCLSDDDIERTEVRLPGNARPRNVALSPSGNQMAVVGREFDEDTISVVTLPNQSSGSGGEPTDETQDPQNSDPTPDRPRSSGAGNPGTGEPDGPDGPTNAPPAESPLPEVVAILEDVDSTGAPPAWAPNNETLAFSAMPADGSHGPDVYVWNVGDARARAITDDHSSFFASWSGRRIVVSRLVESRKGTANVKTVVIDPNTLEERTADIGPVWLPTVNPGRSHALVWYGDLAIAGGLPDPKSGALYMVDWTQADPFAEGAPEPTPEPTDEPTPDPTDEPTPEPTDEPTPEPTAEPTESPSDDPSPPTEEPSARPTVEVSAQPAGPPRVAASATPKPNGGAGSGAGTAPPSNEATPEPVEEFDPSVVPGGFVAVDRDRDTRNEPVIDWQAQWSADGEVLGIWIADVPGSTWGRLIVRALDRTESVALRADSVVEPTLAQRGFTLGVDRVAWVAPTDSNPEGELRIRTWGSDGEGGLRLHPGDED